MNKIKIIFSINIINIIFIIFYMLLGTTYSKYSLKNETIVFKGIKYENNMINLCNNVESEDNNIISNIVSEDSINIEA